jgi:hypothetical protein
MMDDEQKQIEYHLRKEAWYWRRVWIIGILSFGGSIYGLLWLSDHNLHAFRIIVLIGLGVGLGRSLKSL